MKEEEKKIQAKAEESPITGEENEAKPTGPDGESAADGEKRSPKPPKAKTKKRKLKMTKQLLSVIVAVSLVLLTLITVLVVNLVRDRRPPELEEVRDIFENLIEVSPEVNELLFGKGLPTYPRVRDDLSPYKVTYEEKEYTRYYFSINDADYGTVIAYQYFVQIVEEQADGSKQYVYFDILTKQPVQPRERPYAFALKTAELREDLTLLSEADGVRYYALPDYKDPEFVYEEADDEYYDYVRADSPYKSTDDIKDKASAVYSNAYLSAIYENLFTGVAFAEGESGVLYARYRDYVDPEDDVPYLQQCNLIKGYELADRRYDYSTMRIARGSNARYVKIEIESYIAGSDERTTVTLAFAKESGTWLLDTPTY